MPATPVKLIFPEWTEAKARGAFWLAAFSVLPLFVWWLGWFPGFLTSDSIDQLGQADRFEFFNFHPAFHTITIWAITRVWDSAGAVTLAQLLVMAGLLALIARRLVQVGVPSWLAVGAAWLVALLPAVATTTIAIWKDVPYTLALVWVFTELLVLARDPDGFWRGRGALRLGGALALIWLYRHNGFITVVLLVAVLAVAFRHRFRVLTPALAALAVPVVVVQFVLFPLFSVERGSIEPSQVFTSDIAASLKHEPGNFSQSELAYLATIAPLEVWTGQYRCWDSTPLVFDSEFKSGVIRRHPGRFRSLALRTILRDPDTVLGHRWCASSYLFLPAQPADAFFHRPPFAIAANDMGIERDPVSDRAFSVTKSIYVWSEPDSRLWLTWRPALALWAAVIVYGGIVARRSLRRLLFPAVLILAQIVNVMVTSPAQEFRFAFGIYVMSLMSLPLAWLVARPDGALLARTPGKQESEQSLAPGEVHRRP